MGQSEKKLVVLSLSGASVASEGGSGLAHDINARLANRGYEIHSLGLNFQGDALETETLEGVHFHRIPRRQLKSAFRVYRAIKSRINRLLDTIDVDLVHIHDPMVGFLAHFNARLKKIPSICHFSQSGFGVGKNYSDQVEGGTPWPKGLVRVRGLAQKSCLKSSSSIIFLSRYAKKHFIDSYSVKKPRLREIPAAVDVEIFHPVNSGESIEDLKRALGLPTEALLFLMVAHPEAEKGQEALLLAIRKALDSREKVGEEFLLLIAEDSLAPSGMMDRVERHGLTSQVRFLDSLGPQELSAYYRLADVFLLPAPAQEVLETEAIKALASGVPVLAPMAGGMAEILRPIDESLLYWRDDPQSMANSILAVLAAPEKIRALKSRCHKAALIQHSWETILDRIEEEYKVVARKPRQ